MLGKTITAIGQVHASVANLEAVRTNNSNFPVGFVNRARLYVLVDLSLLLTFNQLHALHSGEQNFVAVLELMLSVWQQLNQSLLALNEVLNHAVLQLFAVLVQNFKAVTKVVEYSSEDTVNVGANELFTVLTA